MCTIIDMGFKTRMVMPIKTYERIVIFTIPLLFAQKGEKNVIWNDYW